MKKALLSLLILALVMIPVLVSCEDTSQLEKIGQLMSDFSGVGKVTPEQAQKQTEQAASTIEEKFKDENPKDLDFKEISDMFYDFPAADLNRKTSIDKVKLNEQVGKSIEEKTQQMMDSAPDLIASLASKLGDFENVAMVIAGKISKVTNVFKGIISDKDSTDKATLKDVKEASAVASMCGELAGIVNEVIMEFGIDINSETPSPAKEPNIETMIPVLMSSMDNYNNAAKAYAKTVEKEASEFTIDLASLAGQFLDIN